MIALIGLTVIIIAWTLQFLLMNKKKIIYPSFVTLYVLGVVLLVYDGFSSGLTDLAIANLISLVVSLAVLVKLKFY